MGSFTEFPTLPQKHRYSDSKSSIQARYFYRYHISTDIIFLQISTYYQDPYVGEGKLDPTEIGPNCCWANQFAQFVGWGGVGFSLGEANQFAQFVG